MNENDCRMIVLLIFGFVYLLFLVRLLLFTFFEFELFDNEC